MLNQTYPICKKLCLWCLVFLSIHFKSFGNHTSKNDSATLSYLLHYETLQPLKIIKATLYISPDKLLGKTDSINLYLKNTDYFQDTLFARYPWKFPVHARILIEFENKKLFTNKFYLDPQIESWLISVNDTSAVIKQRRLFNLSDNKNNIQLILIIQILFELILAILFTRIFRWPGWAILVVLAANMAAYPVYLLKIYPHFWAEILAFAVKFLVLFLTSRKRLGWFRILVLIFTLTLISFGIKELLYLTFKLL